MKKNEIYESLNRSYFSDECDEKDAIDHLPELLNDVHLFIDIGASLGQYTYYANKYMSGGHIFAIEADPIRFERLKLNCDEWQKSSTNELTAINAAVSDVNGSVKFHITNSTVSGGLFKHSLKHLKKIDKDNVDWEEIDIQSITLDSFFRDYKPDFIKMDIEGSEWRALKGADNLLKKNNVKCLIELHSWGDSDGQGRPPQVIDLMKELGYTSHSYYNKYLFLKNGKGRKIKGLIKKIINKFS